MNQDISEIESLVIGAVIQFPERFDDCQLQASDFQSVEHRQYFECILAAAAKNQLNPFAVRDIFRQETGSSNDLILEYSSRGLHVTSVIFPQYVEMIKSNSHKSKALRIASQMIDDLNAGSMESIGSAISSLMNLDRSDEKYDHSFVEISHMAVDAYERAVEGNTGAVKTGFTDIDERLGGYHPGDLVIIAARPAMGKTAFMVNSFLRADTVVGVISAEQGAEQIGVRSVCIEGGVNHQNFRRARMDNEEFARFKKALDEFQLMNGRIYDKPAPTILEVEKTARRWVHKHNVGAIYIDYAQRLGHENKRLSSVERNSDIAKRLKELARSLNVPVIALAQVNRQCESRTDKRPLMGDIADASAYEKEADVIFTLYRDEVYNDDSMEKGVIEANFEKNRHGGTGRVVLNWIGQYMQVNDFNNYERQQESFYQSDGYV